MEKIDRELLIKEISSRLPYGVKAQVLGWDEEKGEVEVPLRIYSMNTDGYVYFESNDYNVDCVAVDNCLLYLRPMSSMTEEELLKFEGFKIKSINSINVPNIIELIDWLNEHHFDYRGLIPMGLALEATKGMYDIKIMNQKPVPQTLSDYEKIKKILSLGFMNLLDDNRSEHKMCLSNMECKDIDNAFDNQDWSKLLRYFNKYYKN